MEATDCKYFHCYQITWHLRFNSFWPHPTPKQHVRMHVIEARLETAIDAHSKSAVACSRN